MAHHKRRRPKHQRAGCLMCKPWKDERSGKGRTRLGGGKVDGGVMGKAESALKASVRRRLQPDD